jgi:hypothetical protein
LRLFVLRSPAGPQRLDARVHNALWKCQVWNM